MTSSLQPDLLVILPEIFLSIAAMVLLLLGVYRGDKSSALVHSLSIVVLLVALALVVRGGAGTVSAFGGLVVDDAFSRFIKVLILLGAAASLVISRQYLILEKTDRFEFPVLVLLATVGMLLMTSANDLMSLYLSLELQSLALYVLAAFRRDEPRATESGLKYFVLGALSSGMLLYGCSLIYGFAGTTNFTQLAKLFTNAGGTPSLGLIAGIVFLSAGLAFKVSAVPFHMWVPDVYEGAPTPVTAFFAVAPKIAAMALFVRSMMTPFGGLTGDWRQIIILLAIGSVLLGAFAAIGQNNIKRLMAYSSIGHVGYLLIGLAAGNIEGIRGILIYLAIYLAMNIGTFAIILSMRRESGLVETIDDLAGLASRQPVLAFAMAIFMFSLAGVPPLAGFFGKFYVFSAAVDAKLYTLAVIGVLGSVVGAYYYIRIVKVMYIDKPADPFTAPLSRGIIAVTVVCALLTLLFFVYPAPLVGQAGAAATALFP